MVIPPSERPARRTLPADAHRDAFIKLFHEHQVVIVIGPTGCGKSTRFPEFLVDIGKSVIVTEPRRLAARMTAKRVASERGEAVGETIGVATSQDDVRSERTRCLYATDGLVLVRHLLGEIDEETVLIVDEVQERNLNIDTLLAVTKRELATNPRRKLVLMSATIDGPKFSAYYNGAPILEVAGRMYPITELPPGRSEAEDVVRMINEGHRKILVFLPGKREIRQTANALRRMKLEAVMLPLHGDQTPDDQERCFRDYGLPFVINSTNVAETTVTIDGVTAVIDSGLERRVRLVNGVEMLHLGAISLMNRTQRMGRAGRTAPGVYIDRCPVPLRRRAKWVEPEIRSRLLDQVVLRLAAIGLDAETVEFPDNPDPAMIHEARRSLKVLECLDTNGHVTEKGHLASFLPVSVQSACILLEANRRGVLLDAIKLVAIMEARGITLHEPLTPTTGEAAIAAQQRAAESDSDLLAELALFDQATKLAPEAYEAHGIHPKSFTQALETQEHVTAALRQNQKIHFDFSSSGNQEELLYCICAGMVDQLYTWVEPNIYVDADGERYTLRQESVFYEMEDQPVWLVGRPFRQSRYVQGRLVQETSIQFATRVRHPQDLSQIAPHLFVTKENERTVYDPGQDRVSAEHIIYFNDMEVGRQQDVRPSSPDVAYRAFAAWLMEQTALDHPVQAVLHANRELVERATILNRRAGQPLLPSYGRDTLLSWYTERLQGVASLRNLPDPESLRLPPLDEALVEQLLIDYPDSIQLNGWSHLVDYETQPPTVRLRREFIEREYWAGMSNTPLTLPNGQTIVLIARTQEKRFKHHDPQEVKAWLEEQRRLVLWERASFPAISTPTVAGTSQVLPIIQYRYGRSRLTGELLIAYGTVRAVSKDGSAPKFFPTWLSTREQAEVVRSKSVAALQQARAAEKGPAARPTSDAVTRFIERFNLARKSG